MLPRVGGAVALLFVVVAAGIVFVLGPDRLAKVPERLLETVGLSNEWEAPRLANPPAAQVPIQPVFDVSISTAGAVHTTSFTLAPPAGATDYQIDTDPNFHDSSWVDVGGGSFTAAVDFPYTGYQMAFVRYRLADGTVTATETVGAEVDRRSLPSINDELVTPEWVRTASPNHLVVRVTEGRIVRGGYELYNLDNPNPGDDLGDLDGTTTVKRDGQIYGFAVSARRDVIRRPDYLDGQTVDADKLSDNWTVTTDDGSFEVSPADVITRPYGSGESFEGEAVRPRRHDVVLSLPQSLTGSGRITVSPPSDAGLSTVDLTFGQGTTSRAIHINQGGFAPSDQPKRAVISSWLDGIGDTEIADLAGQPFTVVEAATGAEVASGTLTAGAEGSTSRNELGRGDLTGSVTVEADFSQLTTAGVYRVCVERLGCSEPFPIDARLWHDLTVLTSRSTYHQRSGIELGPPYTSFERPRPYHPEDGYTVFSNQRSLPDMTDAGHDRFQVLAAGALPTFEPEAWGGHFDAGDWDRRIIHLWYSRNVNLLLHEFPELADLEANIPESGDAIPDLLDESLWTVDFYRRLQLGSGAIRGGIEASEHPRWQASSWLEDLESYVYAPDVQSSYLYAGVAAETSAVLRRYDSARADELLSSAVAAMEWAEVQPGAADFEADRNGAAAGLLFATGDRRWHEVFTASAGYIAAAGSSMSCQAHAQCDAAWLYLRSDEAVTDPALRQQYTDQFLASADAQLAATEQSPFGWMVDDPGVPLIWGQGAGGAPHATGLIKAYLLSGDAKYRQAVVDAAGYTLGANPLNQVFNTGIGQNPVRHPLIIDVNHGGLPVWPGTPMYGTHQLSPEESWVEEWVLDPAGADPLPSELPYLHQWFDLGTVAFYNEFTVHQSHAEALLAFGFLAGTAG